MSKLGSCKAEKKTYLKCGKKTYWESCFTSLFRLNVTFRESFSSSGAKKGSYLWIFWILVSFRLDSRKNTGKDWLLKAHLIKVCHKIVVFYNPLSISIVIKGIFEIPLQQYQIKHKSK